MMAGMEAVPQLQQLLVGLSSSDNSVREQHEKAFEAVWVSQPSILIPGLCAVLDVERSLTSRMLAAVLLRRVVSKIVPSESTPGGGARSVRVWQQLDSVIQQKCCEFLLAAWKRETIPEVRNKISDAIAEVARIITQHEEWPQLLEMLWAVDSAQSPEVISSALRIISAVPDCVCNQNAQVIAGYISQFLDHSQINVRLAGLKVLQAIILASSDDKKQAYAPLIARLSEILAGMAQMGPTAEDQLVEGIQAIVEMVDECPKLFRSLALRLTPILIAIADSTDFSEESRSAALELLTTLAEAMPATFRKQKELTSSLVRLLLKTISGSLETEGDEWYQSTPDDENEEEALSLSAESALDRVARALGGAALLPALMTLIPGMLQSNDWSHRYAALRAIANMAEGCADILVDRLEELLELVWPAFTDDHPRVKYAACHALGQLCTDFSGSLQERFAPQCLSSLVGVIVNSSQPRVQSHAAAALINFAEGVDSAIITPVLDGLLERLVSLLGTSVLYLQEQVIATMAAFSSAAGPAFIKYMPQVMPLLMNCLTSKLDKSYRQLQCRALEATTMIALAVGVNAFIPYRDSLLQYMVELQQTELEDDDLILDYLGPAWVRMCQVLGADFAPFVPLVLPRLLEEAMAEPEITIIDTDRPGDEEDYDQAEWEFATIKGRRLGIHTATLDAKSDAVQFLATYITTLQKDFAPYAQRTFTAILPLLHFSMHEGVQCGAAAALVSLVKVFYEASKNDAEQLSGIKMMTSATLKELFAELSGKEGCDVEVLVSLLDATTDIVNISATNESDRAILLSEGFLNQAFEIIDGMLTLLTARGGSISITNQDEDDEEDEAQRDDDNESIIYAVTRLSAAIFIVYGPAALVPSETLLQFCLKCILPGRGSQAQQFSLFRHAALCILDDLVHWLGSATLPIQSYVSQCFTAGLNDPDPDNRQAAAYGIGMCSEHAPTVYETLCIDSLPTLLKMIEKSDSKAPSIVTVTDNAMSAVVRICVALPGRVDLQSVVPRWLIGLPVTHDEDEAPTVYKWLLELLNNGFVNVNGQQGVHILRALIEALVRECLADDSLRLNVKSTAIELQRQLSPDLVQSAITTFTPEQLAKVFNQ